MGGLKMFVAAFAVAEEICLDAWRKGIRPDEGVVICPFSVGGW
jgi:hypothetical protein